MILGPPLWATGSWVDDSWADGTWSTELTVRQYDLVPFNFRIRRAFSMDAAITTTATWSADVTQIRTFTQER